MDDMVFELEEPTCSRCFGTFLVDDWTGLCISCEEQDEQEAEIELFDLGGEG